MRELEFSTCVSLVKVLLHHVELRDECHQFGGCVVDRFTHVGWLLEQRQRGFRADFQRRVVIK